MSEPYLILHLVRGEPAFDIAIKLMIGDEEGWIIPTSGHRARPYYTWSMDDLCDGSDMDMPRPGYVIDSVEPPEGWPDHYPINSPERTFAPKKSTEDLLKDIEL